eukprot:COSAG02_NODE_24298_length_692_cov_1.470489_2_plen_40_part_01
MEPLAVANQKCITIKVIKAPVASPPSRLGPRAPLGVGVPT